MRSFYSILIVFLTALLFEGCQKDVSYAGRTNPQPVLPDPITASLQGNVVDENGLAAVGVTISVGGKTALTDTKGSFRITGAALDKKASLVTAERPGYFKAYRSFCATAGANKIMIKLVKKVLVGTINGASGGEVSLSNGSKVALPANGVVVASSNSSYTGVVNVYAAYIDPTATDIGQTIPGSLMANDKDGKRVTLSSYGMLAVELQATTGEKLQIKSGATAQLTTAIPATAQASAPAGISLWYVDEATGFWKEEGTATKQGNAYVGTVSHFSFWNCDVSINAVYITVNLKTPQGQPLVNAAVRLTRTQGQYPYSTYGWTDSLGQVSGLVPSNEALQLSVLDMCWGSIYDQNVGPFAQATTLPDITVSYTGPALTTITGRLVTCTNTAVTNGFAIISLNNEVRYAGVDNNGNFSTNILDCGGAAGTVMIVGIDNTNQVQSGNSYPYNSPTLNVGDMTVCGSSTVQYINYTLDTINYVISSTHPGDSLTGYSSVQAGTTQATTFLMGNSIPSNNNIFLSFNHSTSNLPGTYQMVNMSVQTHNGNVLQAPSTITVTSFPQFVGDFCQGSFTSHFTDQQSIPHVLDGTFKLRL